MALADYIQLVDDLVPDQSGTITPAARDRAIGQAVLQYGADLPRTQTEDVTWQAFGVYGPVPAGWSAGSWVKRAEYPVGQEPARTLFVQPFQTLLGQQLESVWALPAGAVVRVTFGTRHTLSATEDTIDVAHRLPVAQLAAALLCMQLATFYSGQRETLIGADASSTETRAREYAARAREYRSAYYVGTDQVDPYKAKAWAGATAGSGAAAAGAITAWPGRARERLGGVRP